MCGGVIVVGMANGRLALLDGRNPRTRLASFDIGGEVTAANSRREYAIGQPEGEPWMVGFQYINGPAGVIDVMAGSMARVVVAPAFAVETRQVKPRPLFHRGAFIVAYPWARKLQVCDYRKDRKVKEIELDMPPMAIDGNDDVDGIFMASSDGDIIHIM
jgi:hypothetical protein